MASTDNAASPRQAEASTRTSRGVDAGPEGGAAELLARHGPDVLRTERLVLVPITLDVVEAVFAEDRRRLEEIAGAALPRAWPGRALVERAFCASLDAIRREPERNLWGSRAMIDCEAIEVVGSVIFRGAPDAHGMVEMAYGVEQERQGHGYATEATSACLRWALSQSSVTVVRAHTMPFHLASQRVLEKIGMARVGVEDHDLFGELVRYEAER